MNNETIKMVLIITQLSLAVTTDVRSYKVKNEMNLGFAILGILYNAFIESEIHVSSSLLGLLAPFGILLPLYMLQMLGAGDIKLLCSIGALTGIKQVIISIGFSFIFGAFIAIIIMAFNKSFLTRFKKLYIYLKSCFLSRSIMPYYQLKVDNEGKMHFTIPIAIGTIAASLI